MIEAEVKVLLDKNGLLWTDFMEWMIGQTISSDEKGRTIYWTHDVQQFIHMKKTGIHPVDFD
jgi:hypothetical protein